MTTIRRFLTHLGTQDWLNIGGQLLIVTLGVFLGVQFGNWNDRRIEHSQEQVFLAKLEADFERSIEELEASLERSQGNLDNVQTLLGLLTDEAELDAEQVMPLLDSLVSASRVARPSATFLEMQSSGALSRLDSPELRSALIRYQLETEVANRGLSWALEGFHPTRKVFGVMGRPDLIEDIREAYGEVKYMETAHLLQIQYAERGIDLSREILSLIEESQR